MPFKLNEHVMAKPSKKEEIRARNLFRTYLRVTLLIQLRLSENLRRASASPSIRAAWARPFFLRR